MCDSKDGVLKRCVIRSNTINPFAAQSECPCIAIHGDCISTDTHHGLGAFKNGSSAMDRLYKIAGRDLLYVYARGCGVTKFWEGKAV